MKPRRLYLRIFLSFLAILFVTELLIFILFLAIPAKRFGSRLEQYAQQKVMIFKNLIEEKIQASPDATVAGNAGMKELIVTFGRIVGARVWIQDPDGATLVQSFAGPIPGSLELPKKSAVKHTSGSYRLYHSRHSDFYAVIPFAFASNRSGTIHILLESMGAVAHEGYFAIGLLLIGIVIALLVIPVARPITRRLRHLRQSTLRIADGDLSHRVVVGGADEISQLAGSFNQMTDKLESMLTASRELTANVSHELRTPLARIRIAGELLQEKLEKANVVEGVRFLEEIRMDVDELDRLVNRILELSRFESREAPFTPVRVELTAMIDDLLKKYHPLIARRSLTLETALTPLLVVTADRNSLSTALSNLLDNSVKFTPEMGVIRLEALNLQEGGVSVTIVNTHDPLAEADLHRIFNPFHRIGRTNATGSGLGLAITEKIIRKHGGTIEARNTERGLAFQIWLPQRAER